MVGVIAIVAAQILKSSVEGTAHGTPSDKQAIHSAAETGPAAVLYILAMATLYKFTNKYTPILLVIFGAVAGQFIFID